MTLLFRLPRLLGAFGIACVCIAPIAYAAELEGTPVPVGSSGPVQVQTDSSASESTSSNDASSAASERQQWQQHQDFVREQQYFAREQQDYAREQADHAREQAEHAQEIAAQVHGQQDWEQAEQAPEIAAQVHDQQDWEHNWEQNLSKAFGEGNGNTANLALLIPILAILFIFGGPILLLILVLVFFFGSKRRRQRDMNNNIDKLLAAGRDIPIELLRGDEPKSADDTGNQAKGIRNICLGAGWLLFLTIAFNIKIGAVGFIWIGLGLSQVLIWYLNRPTASTQAGIVIDTRAGQQD